MVTGDVTVTVCEGARAVGEAAVKTVTVAPTGGAVDAGWFTGVVGV